MDDIEAGSDSLLKELTKGPTAMEFGNIPLLKPVD